MKEALSGYPSTSLVHGYLPIQPNLGDKNEERESPKLFRDHGYMWLR